LISSNSVACRTDVTAVKLRFNGTNLKTPGISVKKVLFGTTLTARFLL